MDGNEDVEKTIAAALKKLGVQDVGEKTFIQLVQVERAILQELETIKDLRKEALRHNLSVDSIHKLTGISRQTFYNKDRLLAEYVALRKSESFLGAESRSAEERSHRIADLEAAIQQMATRDSEIVLLSAENRRLKERVASLEASLKTRTQRKGTVIEFPRDHS